VFDNAYCQIAVCSPSRLSFLSGRRPDHAGMYNFINHFRQADCGISSPNTVYLSPEVVPAIDTLTFGGGCGAGGPAPCGGSGQCCSLCTQLENCTHWTYTGTVCHMMGGEGRASNFSEASVSGLSGTHTHSTWTTGPEHFKNSGWLTVQTGKIFHTEEGGVGNDDLTLNGPGMPPNSDPPSWSSDLAMQQVNAAARMFNAEPEGAAADLNGIMTTRVPSEMEAAKQLADRVISSDAVVKLRLAAANRNATGQPFFLAAGFRKPHLAFRFPKPYLDFLPAEDKVEVAKYRVLDESVPPIAHSDQGPQGSPYVPVDNKTARAWRLHYYAAIAWVDSQVGRWAERFY
jgi:arylsulfatase A-like enzyme